ncbi:MAG: hypothetical protein ACFFAE_07945 [Candidatus Hodarchaeota archaeon]
MINTLDSEREEAPSKQPLERDVLILKILIFLCYFILITNLVIWVISFQLQGSNIFLFVILIGSILFSFFLFLETISFIIDLSLSQRDHSPFLLNGSIPRIVNQFYYIISTVYIGWAGLITVGGFNFNTVIILFSLYFPVILSKASIRWKRLQKGLLSLLKISEIERVVKRGF